MAGDTLVTYSESGLTKVRVTSCHESLQPIPTIIAVIITN